MASLRRKIRSDSTSRAVNPATGHILGIQGAKRRAWTAFARFIRKRDPYCMTCPARTTEAGHFFHNTDKENKKLGGNKLWYSEKNVHGQCVVCNRYHSGRRDVYAIRLEEKYGPGILQELYRDFNTPRKWSILELLEIENVYTQKFNILEGT